MLLAVLLNTVLNLEGGVTHVAPPEPWLLALVTLVRYLLLQGRGGVTEQDAVLAAHMLHMRWQAHENLLTLLARVALLVREHFQNAIFCQVYYVMFKNKSHI